ncbi:unnamed protein product [Hydatigera taeniaeformis]|uniref:DMAP-interaction domain-containing protein n=1 Tax=Hydatigena taeniaeformis TaxID=6205 RepID=A0A0R3WKC5_HYDTA|nr:unnamed protein product [Hydatigera taeniaeformis]
MGDVKLANTDAELRKKLAELEKELIEGSLLIPYSTTAVFYPELVDLAKNVAAALNFVSHPSSASESCTKDSNHSFEAALSLSQTGDITEKGYQKKKAKILEQFHVHYYEIAKLGRQSIRALCDWGNLFEFLKNISYYHSIEPAKCMLYHTLDTRDSGFVHSSIPHLSPSGSRPDSPVADSATPALLRRSSHHRYARDEVRYRSEIREEAVKEALQKEPLICLESLRPSKRRQQNTCVPEPGPSHARSESESEASLDTSSQQCPQTSNLLPQQQQHQFLENADVFHKMSDPTPVTKLSNLRITDGTTPAITPSTTAISASAAHLLPPTAVLRAQQHQHSFTGVENILPLGLRLEELLGWYEFWFLEESMGSSSATFNAAAEISGLPKTFYLLSSGVSVL